MSTLSSRLEAIGMSPVWSPRLVGVCATVTVITCALGVMLRDWWLLLAVAWVLIAMGGFIKFSPPRRALNYAQIGVFLGLTAAIGIIVATGG